MICGKSNRNISFNQFYIFDYFQLFTTILKLLVILFVIKMYARNNFFKSVARIANLPSIGNKTVKMSANVKTSCFSESLYYEFILPCNYCV